MTKAATVFLTLFGGVFFLAGIAMFISGVGSLGLAENGDEWVLVIMGTIFAAAGGGVIWVGVRSGVQAKELAAAQARYPSQPWMWTSSWQSRRIEHHAGWSSLAMWAFALFWNGFVVAVGLVGWEDLSAEISEEPAVLLMLLFPIVGVGLLVAAVRTTMQWRRFGTSAIVLGRIPVSLGREFDGVLELPNDVRDAEEVVTTLRCLRTTKSGKNTSTTVLWNDERRHPRSSLGSGPSGPTLNVRFRVPADEPETSVDSGYPSIRWELSVSAAVQGVDFSASYSLPVFRTDETPAPGEAERSDEQPPSMDRSSGVVHRTILRERGPDGAATWDYPPLRAPSAAVFMTIFTIVWSAVVIFLATTDVPGFIVAIFGFFEILLIMGTIDVLLGRVTVSIDRSGMQVRSGPTFAMSAQRIPLSEVLKFRIKTGMTVGSTMYHTIEASLANGKNVTVGKYLRWRGEAEEIVREMEEELRGSG